MWEMHKMAGVCVGMWGREMGWEMVEKDVVWCNNPGKVSFIR